MSRAPATREPRLMMRPDAPPVVLASRSAARARLLAAAGISVEVATPAVDETALKEGMRAEGAEPADVAVALAELKARRAGPGCAPDALVIGADQLLTVAGRWLDKPASRQEARDQLLALAGRRHELWSAAVVVRGDERIWHHVAEARLWMRELSCAFVDRYLDLVGQAALDSVGAYHLEGLGAQLLARVQGDHFVVQGLPLLPLLEFLRERGVLER
ncbi:MAG TPA: nucleoside triphosphate pyrophosphatase [Geminicoccaceae bacterium]